MSETNTLERIDHGAAEMVPGSVDVLLSKALELSVPIETMERLLALRKELKAERARDQFFEAMAMFQGVKPRIPKRWIVKNTNGTVRYRYAKIDDITQAIDRPLAECGLSYSFETEWITEGQKQYEITHCIIKHLAGHAERSSCKIPIDFSNAMNAAQSYATAGSYGRRYSLCNALGITPDEDDDAETTNGGGTTDEGQPKSTIRPPQKAAASATDHDEVLSNVLIEGYNVSKDGKPAGIKVSGEWFNYFDTKLDEPAKAFKTGKVPADIYLKINGKFKNVVRIETHKEESPGSAPSSENGQQTLA